MKSYHLLSLSLCFGLLLSACDQAPPASLLDTENNEYDEQSTRAETTSERLQQNTAEFIDEVEDQGRRLTEVAGQAMLPNVAHQLSNEHVAALPEQQLKYVGRYHTQISCDDAFMQCEKGSAEYILTLLADGTSHRTIVYSGRMYSDAENQSNVVQSYRKDTWSYHEHEIVLHFAEGIEFYYTINDQQNLVMNVDKTKASDQNHIFFEHNYSLPNRAYVLVKAD